MKLIHSLSLFFSTFAIRYRLAPEYHYPQPLDDCVAATRYFFNNAQHFSVDPKRVVIIGNGAAGGNLAAAATLRLAAENMEPGFELQVLVNPALQALDFNTPSYQQNTYDARLPKHWLVNCWLWYAKGWRGHTDFSSIAHSNNHLSQEARQSSLVLPVQHDKLHKKYFHESYKPTQIREGNAKAWEALREPLSNPYFSPLLNTKFGGSYPETLIIASNYDALRDDATLFGRSLEKHGVRTHMEVYGRGVHGQLNLYGRTELGRTVMDQMVAFLTKKL